jgi:hypothetical protein
MMVTPSTAIPPRRSAAISMWTCSGRWWRRNPGHRHHPRGPDRVRLRGAVTPDGRQRDRHLAGEPPADALAVQARQVRSVRESVSLGRMSSVPGPPPRPTAATPASARRPGRG